MARFQSWLFLACLTSLSNGQNSRSSSSTITTGEPTTVDKTSSTMAQTHTIIRSSQPPYPVSSYVWNMPFVGLSDDASHAWGPFTGESEEALAIFINDSNPIPPSSASTRSRDYFPNARAQLNGVEDEGYYLDIITNNNTTMILGVNSALGASYAGITLNDTIPTVPFGLNLGHNGSWDGSLVLGGSNAGASYDKNRVANGSWFYVPESTTDNATFLKTGKQHLTHITIQPYKNSPSRTISSLFGTADPLDGPSTHSAVLDITNDAIVLPAGMDFCNRTNINVTLHTRSIQINTTTSYENNLTISIPTSLTRSSDRCYSSSKDTTNGTIILGRPFFQAAYLMIPDESGQIWLAAAHQYHLYPQTKLFISNQTLTAAADPSATARSSSTPRPSSSTSEDDERSKERTASIIGGTLGAVFGVGLVSWIVFLIFRHRKIARSHFWRLLPKQKGQSTEILMETYTSAPVPKDINAREGANGKKRLVQVDHRP